MVGDKYEKTESSHPGVELKLSGRIEAHRVFLICGLYTVRGGVHNKKFQHKKGIVRYKK